LNLDFASLVLSSLVSLFKYFLDRF